MNVCARCGKSIKPRLNEKGVFLWKLHNSLRRCDRKGLVKRLENVAVCCARLHQQLEEEAYENALERYKQTWHTKQMLARIERALYNMPGDKENSDSYGCKG